LYEKEIELARDHLQKALKLSPNYAHNYYYLSLLAVYDADSEKSQKYIDKAIELDPLNDFYKIPKTFHSILLFEFDIAEKIIDDILNEQPGNNMALFSKGTLLCQQKRYQDALETLLMRSVGDTTNWLVAYTQGNLGNYEMCNRIIDVLLKRRENQYVSSIVIAIAYMGISDYENVFSWLETAKKENDDWTMWLLFSVFEPLHGHPEFIEYLKDFKIYKTFQKIYPNNV